MERDPVPHDTERDVAERRASGERRRSGLFERMARRNGLSGERRRERATARQRLRAIWRRVRAMSPG